MTLPTTPLPVDEILPKIHEAVDRLGRDDLGVLYQVTLQLELDQLSQELDHGFDADRVSGKLADIPGLVRDAREKIHSGQG